jgi:hypothetical protein
VSIARAAACALALASLLATSAAGQIGGRPISGGNPTPGTPQPEPPNVVDRITVTGCLELAKGAPSAKIDGNTVTDARYVLTTIEPPSKLRYKLAAIESQLSPFIGAKVEIAGEPKAPGSNVVQVEFVQRLAPRCR